VIAIFFLVEILKYSTDVVADDLKLWIGKNCCNGSSSDYWEIVNFCFFRTGNDNMKILRIGVSKINFIQNVTKVYMNLQLLIIIIKKRKERERARARERERERARGRARAGERERERERERTD
jgi:hypothetical protein